MQPFPYTISHGNLKADPPQSSPFIGRAFPYGDPPTNILRGNREVFLLLGSHVHRVAQNICGGRSRAKAEQNITRENQQRVNTWRGHTSVAEPFTSPNYSRQRPKTILRATLPHHILTPRCPARPSLHIFHERRSDPSNLTLSSERGSSGRARLHSPGRGGNSHKRPGSKK